MGLVTQCLGIIYFVNVFDEIICAKTSLWNFCDCRFEEWGPWNSCDSECNGEQERERWVFYTVKSGCKDSFYTCATKGSGWDYSRCNTFCHNGGTSDSYRCKCVKGFYGKCCGNKITCGHPGSLSYGFFTGSDYTYGGQIYYNCNSNYKLVDGSSSRRCKDGWSNNGYWSGSKPRCAYYNSCSSSPCKNGATCTNVPDSYRCSCVQGWSGKHCTIDVQPPLVSDCPNNIDINIIDQTRDLTWNIPNFWDPHGNKVKTSSNYPKNSWTFPWGDFTVSYSAKKLNNGMTVECVFNIKIRPRPCIPLGVPLNGAIVCNNWKTDYGKVCTTMCHKNYTVLREFFPNRWYVCVASGHWMPKSDIQNCSVDAGRLPPNAGFNFGANFTSCQIDAKIMQSHYIRELKKSPFKLLCDKFPEECIANNVLVAC